jgi:predicted HTH domain antitoxin
MYYNVFFGDGESMPKTEQTSVVTVRLSKRSLNRVEAVQKLEKVDRSTLFKEFIEDGLRERVLQHYKKGKLTQRCAAELLGITLREFLELLEAEGIPVNWDSNTIKQYMKEKYGE